MCMDLLVFEEKSVYCVINSENANLKEREDIEQRNEIIKSEFSLK